MKTFRHAVIPLIAVLFFSVLAPLAAAQAAPAGVPITWGMVVRDSVKLYLARDLYCPTFGVLLEQHPSEIPTIEIDLRGHTLRGPGTGYGISGFTFSTGTWVEANAHVRNGRLSGWEVALSGSTDFRVSKVVLVNNRTGLLCRWACYLDRSHVGNSSVGIETGETVTVVTRTTIVKNGIGARIRGGLSSSLTISDSVFLGNDVGAEADFADATVSRSLLAKNRVGVLVTGWDLLFPGDRIACATLTKVSSFGTARTSTALRVES